MAQVLGDMGRVYRVRFWAQDSHVFGSIHQKIVSARA